MCSAPGPDTQVHLLERELTGDETLLLCSDGLHGSVPHDTLRDHRRRRMRICRARRKRSSPRRSNTAAATTSRRSWSLLSGALGMAMADRRSRRDAGIAATIGRYESIERIGRGAMGVVYRARDDAMGRDVALKVLMADFEDDPTSGPGSTARREAAAGLSHPEHHHDLRRRRGRRPFLHRDGAAARRDAQGFPEAAGQRCRSDARSI